MSKRERVRTIYVDNLTQPAFQSNLPQITPTIKF